MRAPVVVVVALVVLAVPAISAQPNPPIPNIARGVWLHDAVAATGARCLDGTPQMYYIREASSAANKTKWVMHIQGGAWCTSIENCAERAQTRLGSSDPKYNFPNPADLDHIEGCNNTRWCGAPMVPDATINPLAHDWNTVLIPYCDGGSFTGNNESTTTYKGQTLYFRGIRNLDAVFDALLTDEGLDKATDVIVGGDSAGGMATYQHADRIAAKLPATANFLAIPDSGFFLDAGSYAANFRNFFHFMNSTAGVHPGCIASQKAAGKPLEDCIFVQNVAPFITSRVWAVQSQFDPAQPMTSHKPAAVNAYGARLVNTIQSTLLQPHKANGAWMYSCYQHCGGWEFDVDGTTAAYTLGPFFDGATSQHVWFDNETYPCASCCDTFAGRRW